MSQVYKTALIVLAGFITATGWTETADAQYTEAVRNRFMEGCMRGSELDAEARRFCDCSYREITERVPHADYVKFHDQMGAGEEADPEVLSSITAAMNQCNQTQQDQ